MKSDVSRVSNVSDKIIPVDSTETMEIDLSEEDLHKSLSPNKTPSPDSKNSQEQIALKISDKLMKRLSETSSKEPDSADKMDTTSGQESQDTMSESFDSLDDVEKSIVESEGQPTRNDINEVILGSPVEVQVLKVNPNSKSPVETNNDSSEDPSAELLKKIENQLEKSDENLPGLTINKEAEQKNPPATVTKTLIPPVTPNGNETESNIISEKPNDNQSPADDLLEEMYSESVDASGLSKNEKETNKKKIESKTPADPAAGTNKRKRADENENTEGVPQNKFIKVVDINVIRKLQSGSSVTVRQDNSILKNRLATIKSSSVKESKKSEVKTAQRPVSEKIDPTLPTTIEIKSEPNSDAETENDREDIEAKKQYLSALNISEKVTPKPAEKEVSRVKTRTDSANSNKAAAAARMSKEMKSNRITPQVNQANKTNQSNQHTPNIQEKRDTLPRLIKQLPPKQRARKSFPRPLNSSPKPIQPTRTEAAIPKKVTPPPQPKSTQLESQTTNSNLVILTQQPQSVNTLTVLPSNQTLAYTGSMSNPILTMVQTPPFGNFIVPTTALNPVPPLNPISDRVSGNTTAVSQGDPSGLALNGLIASAHALLTNTTQENISSLNAAINTATCTTTSTVMTPLASVTASGSSNVNTITILNGQTTLPTLIGNKTPSTDINEDFSYLSGYVPDSISKSISEMIHRAPPKLKPRPPGPLSNTYDSGLTSAAGRVTGVVNSVAHKVSYDVY